MDIDKVMCATLEAIDAELLSAVALVTANNRQLSDNIVCSFMEDLMLARKNVRLSILRVIKEIEVIKDAAA